MTIERAIEILDPEHREHYDSIEPVNEACRMGMNALKELAELKEKLESGRLVELPCKVGDTVYLICEKRWSVGKKETFLYIQKSKLTYGNMERVIKEYGKFVFLTKEQAEARLKELQEGKK